MRAGEGLERANPESKTILEKMQHTNLSNQPQRTAHFRVESDSMGPLDVPADALYGASTQRAVLNFPISGYRLDRSLIHVLGLVKSAAAEANFELGLLDAKRASLIQEAAAAVADGTLDVHFPVDIFQTGSGTSSHMNLNEVIANRCSQLAGKPLGSKEPVHPNDHVNLGQSSNDVFPTAVHVALGIQIHHSLLPALAKLHSALFAKSSEFWEILKIGRTHLMDATPIRLGQVFSGFARQVELARHRANSALLALRELPLGGTAVGTGLNRHPDFPRLTIARLCRSTGLPWHEASNHFEAQSAKDGIVEASGHLKTIATSLFKVANDIRWMASGPDAGIGEIQLPARQPGSSIMPGKVNPVLCEAMLQVCSRVIGNDAAVTWAAASLSNFELNTGQPVIAHAMAESLHILSRACEVFTTGCVEHLSANATRCQQGLEGSGVLATGLAPILGFEKASEVALKSAATGKTIQSLCEEEGLLSEEELATASDPFKMTAPRARPNPET
jgi:fumarate hydratase class II